VPPIHAVPESGAVRVNHLRGEKPGFGRSPNMSRTRREPEHSRRSNCYPWPAARRGNWLIAHAMPAQSDQRRVAGARREALEAWRSNHLIRTHHRRRPGTCIARPTKRYGSVSSWRLTNATLLRRWRRSVTFRQTGSSRRGGDRRCSVRKERCCSGKIVRAYSSRRYEQCYP
jgi:hypothetical protein